MKSSLLTNLLVVLALGLCGLCTFQWLRETETRKTIQQLHDSIFSLKSEWLTQSNRIVNLDRHVSQLTEETASQKATLKSNVLAIDALRRETNSLSISNEQVNRRLEVYMNAFADSTNRLAEAYENIKRQNGLMKDLATQRDEYVAKLNESISNRNALVGEFNTLVDRYKQLQDQIAAQQQQKK